MVIYGQRPVEELVASAPEKVEALLVTRRDRALSTEAPIEVVEPEEMDRICGGGNHQGIAARVPDFQYTPLDELIARVADRRRACLLVLDQIQDPQNLGAILRSAVALGADGVVVPRDRAASVTAAVVRASAGLALRAPVAQVTNLARALGELKEHGFWTVGAVVDDAEAPWAIDYDMKTALVLGAEGPGLRRLVEESCDFRVRVPMRGDVDSLNVSVTAGILLYEVMRSSGA